MPRFRSYDSTELAYHVFGAGPPLLCLPGGPARASAYLGDLGGLAADRTLIMLDQRGTGESATPQDEGSYRCERLVDDLEAFRDHLALDRMELLAHSAGATVALLHAARHPDRIARLVLLTPSLRATGLPLVGDEEAQAARADQWWFAEARAALSALHQAGRDGTPSAELTALRLATAPFGYGRWDERARAHSEDDAWQRSHPGTDGFYAGFDPDTAQVRGALKALDVPVLVVAGELDPAPTPEAARGLAALLPRAELVVQAGVGHYPWVDEPSSFAGTVRNFLTATG